jgi:DNA end-binding protein Ku
MPATVWKGYISFGLVSFPVQLFAAARAETVHFHMLHRKDSSRVKEVWYCVEENKPIERSEIVMGYEVRKGDYVVVEDEELKKIAPPTASTMDILQFVPAEDVDPIYFERSYYVAPGDVSKPYDLFREALKETKKDAIAKLTMHGREHVVILRHADTGLILHTLFYENELHQANAARKSEKPAKSAVNRKELTLAKSLIDQLAGPFKPEEFEDTYRQSVEKLIEQKKKGQKITTVEQPKRAPVIDLMEALKRSLKSSEKSTKKTATAKPETQAASKPSRRKIA